MHEIEADKKPRSAVRVLDMLDISEHTLNTVKYVSDISI